ncbi:hypothetical protein GALMADRAFT_221811 [Galerina marginata CBS 339.88]|uniref:F-box domain-containing protein n=1 Tax=Galerina marginata (strain CBS 339.88) TaxID=685588 RepID=A0A067TPU5_GALM3|nr:hypothetical protein GALMADRAFT_221811 [Galerina marginata CBS 339.88]
MSRRSTREPKQAPKSLAEDDFYPEEESELGAAEEDDNLRVPKKARGKKRKADGETSDCYPKAKRARGTRGMLKQLVEMPLDVLFEIFGGLDPIDLLHLARTTQDLRALLMSRSSISVWKQSRSNIPGLPECPDDLSEPQYANLSFGKSCDFCLRTLGNIHTVWSARFKICTKCVDGQFRLKPDHWLECRRYPTELADMVPVIIKEHNRRDKVLYHVELDRRWQAEYIQAKNKRDWLKGVLEKRKPISEHADACSKWYQGIQTAREQQRASAICDRQALVMERLKKLGWEEELSKMSRGSSMPQDHPTVLKACQKELTERALSNLEEFLNSYMQTVKTRRLARERHDKLLHRLPILKSILETFVATLPANALHPSAGELFRDSVVWDIIINTPSTVDFKKEHFDPIVPMLPDIVLRWKRKIEEKLLHLIRTAAPEYTFDPETVFQLATTAFSCSGCGYKNQSLWHPRVLMHSCATKNDYSAVEDADLNDVKSALRQVYWNYRLCLSFKPYDLQLLSKVVGMCGLDPNTATAVDMDVVNPIFECVACNRPQLGRATMTWREVCVHSRVHSAGPEMTLELMNDQEAHVVRARMVEQQERDRAAPCYRELICVHCKETGNTTYLTKHVKKEHGKLNPTSEDIQPLLDANHFPNVFYLWPPREEVEEEQPSATGMVTN